MASLSLHLNLRLCINSYRRLPSPTNLDEEANIAAISRGLRKAYMGEGYHMNKSARWPQAVSYQLREKGRSLKSVGTHIAPNTRHVNDGYTGWWVYFVG